VNFRKAPRKLLTIIIDDLAQSLPKEKQQFFLIRKVDDYLTAQDLMLEFRQSYGEWGGDLFLVDVDFHLSEFPPNLVWGEFAELRPFGPLLALPFLGKEVCAFIPYSSYWGDQNVKNNGFVLIATSMLLAAAKQEFVRVNDVKRMIEAYQSDNSFAQVTEFALEEALVNYRSVLKGSSRIQLIDIGRTIRRLEALEENMSDLGIALPFPLQDAEGVLSIDFAYPPYHFDSIELSSIFADLLNYSQPDRLGAFQPIFDVLEVWRDKPTSVERGGNLLTEAARKVLTLTEGSSDDDETQMLLDDAIDEVLKESDLLEEHQLKRIVMEFAWVRAWYEEKWEQRSRPTHVKQNSTGDEDSEPVDAAVNQVTKTEKVTLITRVHTSLALNRVNNPANRYRRLLCQTVQGVDRVSDKKWRTPFKIEFDGVNDAYQLDKDEPSALPPFEKALCIQYALDELRWDGNEIPYPRWMTV
jgi:hypothetical protein